jgi:hypothetical protein
MCADWHNGALRGSAAQAMSEDQQQLLFDFEADALDGDGNDLHSTTPNQSGPSQRAAWHDDDIAGQGLGLPLLTLPKLGHEAASPGTAPERSSLLASPVQQGQGKLSEMKTAGEREAPTGAAPWLLLGCAAHVSAHARAMLSQLTVICYYRWHRARLSPRRLQCCSAPAWLARSRMGMVHFN